jgi:hypothetical protein
MEVYFCGEITHMKGVSREDGMEMQEGVVKSSLERITMDHGV